MIFPLIRYPIARAHETGKIDGILISWKYLILTIWVLWTLQYVITNFWEKFGHPTSTLGMEKHLLSVSALVRPGSDQIIRYGPFIIIFLIIFVIWVGLSIIEQKKKKIVMTKIIVLTVTPTGVYHIYIYIYKYICTIFT